MQFSDYQVFELIKKLAAANGYSLGKLQRELGVNRNYLSQSCSNGSLRIDVLLKVGELLGVDITYFFTEGKEGGARAIAPGPTATADKERIEELEALLEEKERVIKAKEEALELYRKMGK